MMILNKVYRSIVLLNRKMINLIHGIGVIPFKLVRRSSKRKNQIPEGNISRDIED